MFYKPHKLYVKKEIVERDAYNRPIPSHECFHYVCDCRCDDNNIATITTEDGQVYRPNYHIVCEGHVKVGVGCEVRVMDGDNVRGEGKVVNTKVLNYLNYSEVWV